MSARYIRGNTRPIFAPVLTAQALTVADLAGLSSGNIVRAEDTVWQSAVAAPSAPTVAASAATRGTALTNSATGVKVAAVFPWGEGALSAAGSATPTAAFGLKVTLAALPAPAVAWRVYVETSAGSGTYLLQQETRVSAGIIYVDSYGTGAAPGTLNAGGSAVNSGALDVTQYTFAQTFLGCSGQTKAAALVRIQGNSADNIARVDADGIWEFDCAAATFAVGDLVGADKASGNALLSQQVVAVAHQTLAIGEVTDAVTTATKVRVQLLSRKVPGALQI